MGREGFSREGGAEEAEGPGVLFFNGADGDAEAVGDFAMGQECDLTQEQVSAAARGELGEGLLEEYELWAGHDPVGSGGGGGGGGIVSGIG